MNSPLFGYSPAPKPLSPSLTSSPSSISATIGCSLTDRINYFKECIDELPEQDLCQVFVEIVREIFGHGSIKGWELDRLKLRTFGNQKYISTEMDSIYFFLCSNGYIFRLCYKLLSNSLFKFHIYFSDLPTEVGRKIEKSQGRSYYGSRFLYHMDSNIPIGLNFNSFEYYFFHFALFGLKMTSDDITNLNIDPNQQSVYRCLCLDYLNYFLPFDNPASMIPPQFPFKVLSSIPNQKQSSTSSKALSFIRKDIASKDLTNDKVESSSWTLTSEATWRSELVAFFFTDIWLNHNVSNVPSTELTKLVRCFIKHLHMYTNCAEKKPVDNLKLILIARHGIKIYQYLAYYMDKWPQDFSFRLLLENWLSYIQPWRYDEVNSQQQSSITESEMNNKWRIFIIRNLLCYTKLFHLAIKRFINIDICSPRYSTMVCRMLKVFSHPYLLKMVLDVENMYINNQLQQKKWNILLSECIIEAESPMFKYELMFSEERNNEYKLFYSKLQKSLDHVAVELYRFQEEKNNRIKSSMLEFILTPRKNKISDYTLSEWEDIQINLKSSLLFMEQIINVNFTNTPTMANSSMWSITGYNTSNLFNKSQSFIQSFENNTLNSSSRVIHATEWEMDPDFIGTLSYENDFLVNLSVNLRKNIEFYWNSYILKFSTENTILAGVLRQTIIRAPMKIFSYELRQDGSGKRVRTPKIVAPTISFRWMASYYMLAWILFLLTLVFLFNNTVFWIGIIYVFRIIFLSLKYSFGYAPPFKWDNFHEN